MACFISLIIILLLKVLEILLIKVLLFNFYLASDVQPKFIERIGIYFISSY